MIDRLRLVLEQVGELPDNVQEAIAERIEAIIMKTTNRETFEQALQVVLKEHAATFEYLKDK